MGPSLRRDRKNGRAQAKACSPDGAIAQSGISRARGPLRAQPRLEERDYRGVEFAMEGHAVKPRRITADFWRDARQCRRARCEERKVTVARPHGIRASATARP